MYNYPIANGWSPQGFINVLLIVKWSLLYDAVCIALINLPLFFLCTIAGKLLNNKIVRAATLTLFTVANTFLIFLNTIDIFYYRFHLQRADADLLYVLRNPFTNGTVKTFLVAFAAIILIGFIAWFIYRNLLKITTPGVYKKRFSAISILLFIFLSMFYISGSKKLLPTYPLTELEAVQLPLAQNSFYSFLYSMYRRNEAIIPDMDYMSTAQQHSLFTIEKKNTPDLISKKNIVLFIMESVPADFFDAASPYKVNMPFLDSLVNKSTYFSNAFSYSYNSNKGITAILAGLPTVIDVPLYHSNYTSLSRTSAGTVLAKNNYSSAFFIGDNYDDFGFAKCCKWLGIQHYYCMQDIPGNGDMEKHSMGLHDEFVLNFMQQKLAVMKQPFFAVQYNISTHYPWDVPTTFNNRSPNKKTTEPMNSMQYYNDCLQHFFAEASKQSWYKNAVFIFCADHWAQPDNNIKVDEVASFRIPIFIYDPSKHKQVNISSPVSQLDIINTVLNFGAVKDSFVSYGLSLTDTVLQKDRIVYTKLNSAVFQAINDEYVLGFDAVAGKALYCYDYKKDAGKKNNLLHNGSFAIADSLIINMKAFLQTAGKHYRNLR